MAQTSVLIQLGRWIDTGQNTNSFRKVLWTEVHWVPGKASRRKSWVRKGWEEEKQESASRRQAMVDKMAGKS